MKEGKEGKFKKEIEKKLENEGKKKRKRKLTLSTKISETYWTVSADFPTPPDPRSTILYSSIIINYLELEKEERGRKRERRRWNR